MVKDLLGRTVVVALFVASCLVLATTAMSRESDSDPERFDYLEDMESGEMAHHQNSINRASREVQQGLPVTGEPDHTTLNKRRKLWCGLTDDNLPSHRSGGKIGRRSTDKIDYSFSLFRHAVEKFDLTYKFENYHTKLPTEKQEEAIAKAFQVWADVSPFTFRQVRGNISADVVISFKDLGGEDITLAEAGPPPNGSIKFDAVKKWSLGSEGYNLGVVAAHEIGHVLGLGHTLDKSAVMFKTYRHVTDYALGQTDIDGIHFRYTIGCQSDATACFNGGTCKTDKQPAYCECSHQYLDERCETEIGCKSPARACLNRGTCIFGYHKYYCSCIHGLMGDRCEIRIGCKSPWYTCLNGGKCILEGKAKEYSCKCAPGYRGKRCKEDLGCLTSQTACLNRGRCEWVDKGFHCMCLPSHGDKRCQIARGCMSDQAYCLNGGRCKREPMKSYICQCPRGFVGSRCQTAQGCKADVMSCLNGGTCTERPDGDFECQCPPGIWGFRCHITDIPDCRIPDAICLNEGKCKEYAKGRYQCDCPPGYLGSRCQTANGCMSKHMTCLHGGKCMSGYHKNYECSCKPGFRGDRCEMVLGCLSAEMSCLNGGTCAEQRNGYYECQCPPNLSGFRCHKGFGPGNRTGHESLEEELYKSL